MLKIAVIGPESTGKTALCQQLAAHFHSPWEPELARGFVENIGRAYTLDDVVEIAKLQIEQEKRYDNEQAEHPFVFFDTDLIITKVWFEHKYKQTPDFIQKRLETRFMDYYLLLEPDLPWEFDPVRENGDNREFFARWYEKEIIALGTPYTKIYGVGEKRLQHALEAVTAFNS